MEYSFRPKPEQQIKKTVRVTDSGRRGRHVVERIVALCREFVTT